MNVFSINSVERYSDMSTTDFTVDARMNMSKEEFSAFMQAFRDDTKISVKLAQSILKEAKV